MGIRIVRLGTKRARDEGLRIGTVRRPPRGVARTEFSRQDWYDVWYPELAPDADTVTFARAAADPRAWKEFERRYRAQVKQPGPARTIALLAALSRHAKFSVGCYCEDESRCHRSILKDLLVEQGAATDGGVPARRRIARP